MFRIDEDKTIHLTRGDVAPIEVDAEENGIAHVFQPGDIIRFKVVEKKDCESVMLQKDVTVTGQTTVVDVFLDGEDTKIGEVINKPKDYWYEVEKNPDTYPQTILGYDEEGPKVLRLYPEGSDVNEH